MHRLILKACTAAPFGAYLKALGVFRLIAEQRDADARGSWSGDTFVLESNLDQDQLTAFFLEQYEPTPILAPWNNSSGFYERGKDAVAAIQKSTDNRFILYRKDIGICQSFPEVLEGKDTENDERRSSVLRRCRNLLSDRAVDWLDAAAAISADGGRSVAPILGTGGNDGNLEFSNNFMARISSLLLSPRPNAHVRELLVNALLGDRTKALQDGSAGQFDPGRAGGANQGPEIAPEMPTNPWDLILTLEGAVAWASGLYRRQGTRCRTILCSPFTVRAEPVGYGSSCEKDDARAEVWAPLWDKPVHYSELRVLLREGRASISGRPARNALEFAEAARSLGVDRSIRRFVRYSMLKRRGKSYLALPTGTFPTGYKSETDLIRKFQHLLDALGTRELPKSAADLRREIDSAMYQALLAPSKDRMRELMAAFGRMLRRSATTTQNFAPRARMAARDWIEQCDFHLAEVRIAAALASIYDRHIGAIKDNLFRAGKSFAWSGSNLCERLVSVLSRRLQLADAAELTNNPLGASYKLDPGDATLFIEGSVDDGLIEELLFAFVVLDWKDFKAPYAPRTAEVLPVYQVLKHLFLSGEIRSGDEPVSLRSDARILSRLAAGDVEGAAEMAVHRLRVALLRPLDVTYRGGVDRHRLAASLLIPVWPGKLAAGIFHPREQTFEASV